MIFFWWGEEGSTSVLRTLLRKLSRPLGIAKLAFISLMYRNQEASRIKAKCSLKAQRVKSIEILSKLLFPQAKLIH